MPTITTPAPAVAAVAEDVPAVLFSIPAAQAYLGNIGLTMLYELVKQGELTKVKIGRRGLITAESLQANVAKITAEAA